MSRTPQSFERLVVSARPTKAKAKPAEGNGAADPMADTRAVMETVFGPLRDGAWTTAVRDPKRGDGQWAGGRYAALSDHLAATADTHGHYYNCTTIKAGAKERNNANSEFGVSIVFDDVGDSANPRTKIEKVYLDNFGPEPTYVVETSPGSHQYHYVLAELVALPEYKALFNAFADNPDTSGGFNDASAGIRYVRLPSGVNPKSARGYFRTRLVSMSGKKYTLAELVEAFGLTLKPPGEDDDDDDVKREPGAIARKRVLELVHGGDEQRLALIRQAMAAIPNNKVGRSAWIHMAHAIDGALDGADEAETIFFEFTKRRQDGEVDPEEDKEKWESRGQGRAGIGYIMQQLEALGTPEATAAHHAIRIAQLGFKVIANPDDDGNDAKTKGRFDLIPFEAIGFDSTMEWLIKRVLPRQALGALFGLPRSYKSFLALDIAFHVALGWDWAGRRTTQCAVVYIAAENAAGTAKRKVGFELANIHRLPSGPIPFYLITTALNLGTDSKDRDALVAAVKAVGTEPGLIIFDTLGQSLGGAEENSTGMVNFVGNGTALANHYRCCVLAVHHVPLSDDQRLRGHTSLPGGTDAQLLAERDPVDTMKMITTLKKLKDEEDDSQFAVFLKRIVIGTDEDNEEISTLIVERIEFLGPAAKTASPASSRKKAGRPAAGRRLLMEVTERAIDEKGRDFRTPDGALVRAVNEEEIRPRYFARLAEKAKSKEEHPALLKSQGRAFSRAVANAITAKEIIAHLQGEERFLWLPPV